MSEILISTLTNLLSSLDIVANDRGLRAEILKYNVNFEPNLGPRLFATLSVKTLGGRVPLGA